jgi:hypothetical protein
MIYPREGEGAPYMPTPEELAERTEMVRRSWSDPALRAKLGLNSMMLLRNSGEDYDQSALDED